MNKWFFYISLLVLPVLPKPTLAHGAKIEYRSTQGITIQANYDDGTPMKNAQVVIYAPSDRATPWMQGTTDNKGNFSFVPDSTIAGDWDVKVRQAGHGDLIAIPLAEGKTISQASTTKAISSGGNYSPLQKTVMAMAGIWGFVGTALFFSRQKSSE